MVLTLALAAGVVGVPRALLVVFDEFQALAVTVLLSLNILSGVKL
jgi:hypothetical protein